MIELDLKDLKLVTGGMGVVVQSGRIAGQIASKPSVQGAALGGATHLGENFLRGQPNTAEGIAGAMVGGAIGGKFSNSKWGGTLGALTGAGVEGTLTGKSPLRKEFHNATNPTGKPNKSGVEYAH